jgi:hypothetical protein
LVGIFHLSFRIWFAIALRIVATGPVLADGALHMCDLPHKKQQLPTICAARRHAASSGSLQSLLLANARHE